MNRCLFPSTRSEIAQGLVDLFLDQIDLRERNSFVKR